MITLFGTLESGNVHKVQMMLRRVAIPFRRVDVAQTRGEPRSPQFLQLNPVGKIPAVLLDGGDVLSESGAILYYFSRDTPLWPNDTRSQAEVLRWMFFEQYSHEPSLAVIRYLKNYVPEPERCSDQIQRLIPKARHALEVMEQRLASGKWIAGDVATIADYALYPYTRVAHESGFDLAEFPATITWLERFEALPDFLAVRAEGAVQTVSWTEYLQADGWPQ